jgi:hypothetical protein
MELSEVIEDAVWVIGEAEAVAQASLSSLGCRYRGVTGIITFRTAVTGGDVSMRTQLKIDGILPLTVSDWIPTDLSVARFSPMDISAPHYHRARLA